MNLKEQLEPLFNTPTYKGKTTAEISRIAGIDPSTLSKAFSCNEGHGSIRTSIIEKLCAPTGKTMVMTFKRVK